MSPDTNAPHAGTAEPEPVPVWDRNAFDAVVWPAKRTDVSDAD